MHILHDSGSHLQKQKFSIHRVTVM